MVLARIGGSMDESEVSLLNASLFTLKFDSFSQFYFIKQQKTSA